MGIEPMSRNEKNSGIYNQIGRWYFEIKLKRQDFRIIVNHSSILFCSNSMVIENGQLNWWTHNAFFIWIYKVTCRGRESNPWARSDEVVVINERGGGFSYEIRIAMSHGHMRPNLIRKGSVVVENRHADRRTSIQVRKNAKKLIPTEHI